MSNRLIKRSIIALCLITALYSILYVDVNHAFALQSIKVNQTQQIMPQSLPNLTISGQWRYYDRDGTFTPAKYYLVGIYTATDPEQIWGWGYTDDAGHFSIGPFANPGTKIRARIFTYAWFYNVAGDYEITIAPPGGNTWEDAHFCTSEDDYGPFADVSSVIIPSNPNDYLRVPYSEFNLSAFWIKNDLQDGFNFLPDKIGDYFAIWRYDWNMPPPANESTYGAFFDSACCWSPWCIKPNAIHLNSEAANSADGRDTVIHEMGHAVMYYAYDYYLPCDSWSGIEYLLTCMNHIVNEARTDKCGWIEGWADFWSVAVQNIENPSDTSFWQYDLEDATWNNGWANGDMVEGRVAGTLWDIFDPADLVNDGFDTYSDGFDEIWDILSHQTDNTFAEFYDAWWKPPKNYSKIEFLACAYQNTIVYDTATLEEALDTPPPGLTWTTGGNGNWFGEKFQFFSGDDAAQSAAITHSQETWVKTNVTGPGKIKFYWKVSSESNYDFLRFYIDSSQKDSISGDIGWQQKEYPVSSGSHDLIWKYTKDTSLSSLCDCGWLDKVEWIPSGGILKLIGTDTPGDSNTSANRLILGKFLATQTGNITEMRVYSLASGNVKVAVYADNAGSPTTLLGAENTSTAVTANQWNYITLPSSVAVTANTYYWLAAANSAAGAISYDPAVSGTSKGKGITFSSFNFPDPAGNTGFTNYTYERAFAGWGTLTITSPTIGYSPSSFNFSATQGGGNPTDKSLSVWNSGGGTLNWSVSDDANWLTLDPTSGSSTGETDTVTVSVNISGMSAGNYSSTITILATGATNTPQYVSVNLTINPSSTEVKLIGSDTPGINNTSASRFILSRFQATQTGNITQMQVHSLVNGTVKVAVYADSGGSPTTVRGANDTTPTPVTANQWNTITLPSTHVDSGTWYWLAVANDVAGAISYDPANSGTSKGKGITFSSFSFPDNPTGFTNYTYERPFAGWGTIAPTTERLLGTTSICSSNTGADRFILLRCQAQKTGTLTEIRLYSVAGGNAKVALYADVAGAPGDLLAANNNNNPCYSSIWNSISITPTPVTQNSYYWIAAIANTSGILRYGSAGSGTSLGRNETYSSFIFPPTAGSGFTNYTYNRAFDGWGIVGP